MPGKTSDVADSDKHYTGDEVRGIVNQKLLEQRLEFVENTVMDMAKSQERNNAQIQESVRQLVESMKKHQDDIKQCRNELRDEIERDFMTKTEGNKIFLKMDQINTRLMLGGAGVVIIISAVNFLFKVAGGP